MFGKNGQSELVHEHAEVGHRQIPESQKFLLNMAGKTVMDHLLLQKVATLKVVQVSIIVIYLAEPHQYQLKFSSHTNFKCINSFQNPLS